MGCGSPASSRFVKIVTVWEIVRFCGGQRVRLVECDMRTGAGMLFAVERLVL